MLCIQYIYIHSGSYLDTGTFFLAADQNIFKLQLYNKYVKVHT